MNVLIFNFGLYLMFFIWALRRAKWRISFYSFAIFLFLFYAFWGVYAYYTGAYTDVFHDNGKFPYEPLVVCFISIFIFLLPFKKFNTEVLMLEDLDILDNKRLKIVCDTLFCLFFLLTIAYGFNLLDILGSGGGLADAYNDFHEEGNKALHYSRWQNIIIRIVGPINFAFYWFVIIIALLKLSKSKQNQIYWTALILFTTLPDLLLFATRSARGEYMYLVFKFVGIFIILRPYLSKNIKKKIIYVSSVALVIMLVFTLAISTERFAEESNSGGIVRYFGEPFPNLSNQLWGNVMHHPMGIRMFPYILDYTPNSSLASLAEQHLFWEYYTGVPMLNFKTIYGDFYIEFGELGGFIAILVLTIFIYLFLKSPTLHFYQMPIFSVILHILVVAPLLFAFRGTSKFETFLWCIFSSFFIKHYLVSSKNNIK